MSPDPVRVVLADDHAMVRTGLVAAIELDGDIAVVAEADDGEQAVHLARVHRPDVVVMDVQMPVRNGIEATSALVADRLTSERGTPVAVLALTAHQVDEAVYRALRAGASGFLLKRAAATELRSAVRAVHRGDAWLDPAVARLLVDRFATLPDAQAVTSSALDPLTRREREVIELVAIGKSNAEIATDLVISEGTAKAHVSHAMTKLQVRDRAQAVSVALRLGLVAPRDPSRP